MHAGLAWSCVLLPDETRRFGHTYGEGDSNFAPNLTAQNLQYDAYQVALTRGGAPRLACDKGAFLPKDLTACAGGIVRTSSGGGAVSATDPWLPTKG